MLNLIMIFGSTNKEISQIAAMFYTSLGKTAWSIGIAWIIVACATGHGGKIICFFYNKSNNLLIGNFVFVHYRNCY